MSNKVFIIKSVHVLVFIFQSACLLYILYCGVTKTYGLVLLLCIISIIINALAASLNHRRCPLTTLAEKYGAEKGSIAPPHTARVGIALFITGLVLLGV